MTAALSLPARILPNGDAALVVEFGDRVDLNLNEKVLALAERIGADPIEGIVETVPTFRSLLVSFDPARIAFGELGQRISVLLGQARSRRRAGRRWKLPVCYDPKVAPDLEEAAKRAGLTPEGFVARHSGMIHHVYMLGFLPGQPYLGDLPAELALPRRETQRTRVPAGSVGVAQRMTCLFPKETPCGLNIIGRTPVALWDDRRPAPALIAPGDSVALEPVAFEEFAALAERAERGEPVAARFGPGPTGIAA